MKKSQIDDISEFRNISILLVGVVTVVFLVRRANYNSRMHKKARKRRAGL